MANWAFIDKVQFSILRCRYGRLPCMFAWDETESEVLVENALTSTFEQRRRRKGFIERESVQVVQLVQACYNNDTKYEYTVLCL